MNQQVGTDPDGPPASSEDGGDAAALAVVKGFNDALGRGDLPGMIELLDPELEWRAPESLPWGGTFRGRAGFQEFLRKVFEAPADWDREFREYIVDGDRVVVLLRLRGKPKQGEGQFDLPEIHVWKVRHGRVVDFDSSFDTATVLRVLRLEQPE